MRRTGSLSSRVVTGGLFAAIATLGLAATWNYATGTAVNMGTGYVPKLLCWLLLGLGILIVLTGFSGDDEEAPPFRLWPLVLVPAALVIFALTIEQWGLLISGSILVLVGGYAQSKPSLREIVIVAAVLILVTWALFIRALGLNVPLLPVS